MILQNYTQRYYTLGYNFLNHNILLSRFSSAVINDV